MPADDGTMSDGLEAYHKAFKDDKDDHVAEVESHEGHHHRITVVALDEHSTVSLICRNGHIVEWLDPETQTRVGIYARYPSAELIRRMHGVIDYEIQPIPVCPVCGEDVPYAPDSEEGQEEGGTDGGDAKGAGGAG